MGSIARDELRGSRYSVACLLARRGCLFLLGSDLLHHALVDPCMVSDGLAYDFDANRGLVRPFYRPMLRDAVLNS